MLLAPCFDGGFLPLIAPAALAGAIVSVSSRRPRNHAGGQAVQQLQAPLLAKGGVPAISSSRRSASDENGHPCTNVSGLLQIPEVARAR